MAGHPYDTNAVRQWAALLLKPSRSLTAVERRELARDLEDAATEIERLRGDS